MKRGVRIFLQTLVILLTMGITAYAQPVQLTDIPNNSTNFNTVGDLAYFTAGDALWRTDGTDDGTILLRSGFTTIPSNYRELNGMAIFTSGTGSLWRSDGTPSGTVLLTSGKSNIEVFAATASYLFFRASDASTGAELYRTDGTAAGTVMVKDVNPGTASGIVSRHYLGNYSIVGNEFFFAGNNGVTGIELWKSDGTSAGTSMVADINPGTPDGIPADHNFFLFNDQIFFSGIDNANGKEPWVTDGTAEGTRIIKDISAGPGSTGHISYSISNNGALYFLVSVAENDYDGAALWKTSGTSASTSELRMVGEVNSYNRYHFFLTYKGKVYFFHRLNEFSEYLWVSDGTSAGTRSIATAYAVEDGISFFDVIGDYLVYGGGVQGRPTPLYRTDGEGEPEAFYHFKSAGFYGNGRSIYNVQVTRVGDLGFFSDHDGLYDYNGGTPHSEDDYFHLFQTDAVKTESMRTMFGVNTIGSDNITSFNGKVLFTTRNDQYGSTDDQKRLWIYDPSAPPPPPVASFTLVNAETDKDVRRLLDGALISNPYNAVPLTIRYNHAGEQPGSVVFKLNDVTRRTETAPPYALAGDINGDYTEWEALPGTYKLTAIPYSEAGGQGTAGEELTITFTIKCQSGYSDCTPTGQILWEQWTGVPGNSVSEIPVTTERDKMMFLEKFEGPSNIGTNYGARYRGYLIPPADGAYTLWIASNDHSELWLSTDDKSANKRKIASVTGATNPREWNKFASQKSAPVTLSKGVKYYVEALHKQGAGTDHMAVGWQLPDGTLERPIPAPRLSPFLPGESQSPTAKITSPAEGQTFTAPADILIEVDAYDGEDGTITKVQFYAGPKDQTGTKIGEDITEPFSFLWENVGAGNYDIYAFATDADNNTSGTQRVNITVQPGGPCASGTITREYWGGVQGNEVSLIPVHREPDATSELTIFEGPSNVGTNYGSRIRGYICPPVTGNYNFWIASNDHSELWISTDDDPANRRLIAYTNRATGPREWNKFGEQRSTAVALVQGQRYYIEALHKQGIGTDHVAVGWSLPDGTLERPIPGSRLSPFESGMQAMAFSADTTPADEEKYSQISVYPNPARSGDPELTVSGYEGIDEPIETHVEIVNMTGDIVFAETISCGGSCSDYLVNLNRQLVPGVYLVNLKTKGTRFSKRLLVK